MSVFLTKVGLRSLSRRRLPAFSFLVLSVVLTFTTYFLFTLVVYLLRVYDMVTLYAWQAPSDPMPVVEYHLFPLAMAQWVTLQSPTIIYVTPRGWFSTYFFPESVLFYGMVLTASMLPFLAVAYALVSFTSKL